MSIVNIFTKILFTDPDPEKGLTPILMTSAIAYFSRRAKLTFTRCSNPNICQILYHWSQFQSAKKFIKNVKSKMWF